MVTSEPTSTVARIAIGDVVERIRANRGERVSLWGVVLERDGTHAVVDWRGTSRTSRRRILLSALKRRGS